MPVFDVNNEDQTRTITAVKFSHGDDGEKKTQMTWQFYKRKKMKNMRKEKAKRLVTATGGSGVTMVGKNFGSHPHQTFESCDYYMGILDKANGKMRVIPAELIQMEPHFEESESLVEGNADKTLREKTDDLTKEFGSGRMQRAVLKRQKNKLDTEMLSSTTKYVAETSLIQEEALGKAEETIVTETSAVPPHNKEANRPEDVYKLKDIISQEMMSPLTEQGQVLYDCTKEDIQAWAREKTYPQFILNKLSSLSVREEARRLQCQCLIYLHCLIKVFHMKPQHLRAKDPLPKEWKWPVRKHILSNFTVEIVDSGRKKRQCPSRLRDKMLSHILVLCLKLSNFHIDLNTLMADLAIPRNRLNTHCTILGCTVKTVKDAANPGHVSHTATLTVPLKFPELKTPSKRKGFN